MYYDSGKNKKYLTPELKAYWDWNRQQKALHPELTPYMWASKESQGVQPVSVDLRTMVGQFPPLAEHMELLPVGGRLTDGDIAVMRMLYERIKPNLSFYDWMQAIGYDI